MKSASPAYRLLIPVGIISIFLITAMGGYSQTQVTNDPPFYGPFNAVLLPDGDGLNKHLVKNDPILLGDSPWSIFAWLKPTEALKLPSLLAGLGDPEEEFSRYLA